MNSLKPEPTNLACPKHGSAPYLAVVGGEGIGKRYCLTCFDEAMTRLGVHGMFPVIAKPVVDSDASEFPEGLELDV